MAVCSTCGFQPPEPFKFCPECGAESIVELPSREQRKTVSVLFCDLTGSTALGEQLDPERLRSVLARYFDEMKMIVERHGGTVEKFIGDAVMAVFGVPIVHEDDALRAARAAVEMRDALPGLGLQGRIGVMTGEVVTGTAERLVTGDAVNVAARLEQAAPPGEVLIGQPTLALVRDAVEVEPVEPLALKGKTARVLAYRLLRVLEAPERRHDARFVGRQRELSLVREAWERVQTDSSCQLVTIVGDAGVGKSRLVAEALASVEATVVRGRCLPYGRGITYWPVVEVLKQLDLRPPDETAAAAIRSLLAEDEAATSAEEIAWAFRKTLEHAAAERPLVVVFDDIQWGEETFRDLIEHVALLSSDAAILLLCMARPELTERHPDWPVSLRLESLGDDDVDELIARRVPAEMRAKIARAAGGNPLFIEEMLAMAAEGDMVVPPTLQALLAARLDQLGPADRSVLERGAVEGESFHRGAVQALAPEGTQVTPRLAALVRKQLIRPDKTLLPGEDGFRFRHLLLRDAAYEALPKATRAELHHRYASWLEQHGSQLVELDEILGYHLEQACHYHAELGLPDDGLAATARRRLTASGRRAAFRQDLRAAVSLFERAAALVPATEIDLALEIDLGNALFESGRVVEALGRGDALAERGAVVGDLVGELCGRIQAGKVIIFLEPEGATEKLDALVEQALPVFQAAGNDAALSLGYTALIVIAAMHGQSDEALEAVERAAGHARQAGLSHEFDGERAGFLLMGTTPVPALLVWLDEQALRERRNFWLVTMRGWALAMLGNFDEARAILAELRAELAERGGGIPLAMVCGTPSIDVELLAGDPAAAAEFGAEAARLFEELGEQGMQSTTAGMLARALYALDRLDEADVWAGRAAELGATDDVATQAYWRQARAKVLARRGEHAEAEWLVREAVAISDQTDDLNLQGGASADLAEVLLLGGKRDAAVHALEDALERYDRKGNLASTAHVQARLADLQGASTR